MKAFLLAAGKGSRISKNIPDIPKCTLDVGGKPLILRTVEMFLSHGVEVVVIVGYRDWCIRDILKDYPVNIVYNPFYDVTNSIGSLWMAKDYFSAEDTIIANADVFWSKSLFDFICDQKKDVFMLSDIQRVLDGDYFFRTENDVIKDYGKELKVSERSCEYVGIAFIGQKVIGDFLERLILKVSRQEHQCWWENVLYDMTSDRDIYSVDVEGRFWAEIDFIEDYHRIIEYVKNNENQNERWEKL